MRPPRILRVSAILVCAIPALAWSAGPVVLAESLKPSDIVTGPIKVGRRTLVLPAGVWQLVTTSERNSGNEGTTQTPTLMSLFFQELRAGRLGRGLEVVATKTSRTVNWLDEPCKSKGDSYWISDRRTGMNNQFCLRVGYKSGMVDGARGESFQAWARDIKSKSIGYSPEMPFVSVTRYTPYDYLQMTVSFDPSTSGISPSANPTRSFNDWLPETVAQRPTHSMFYEALVSWAPTYAAGVQRAFDGDESLSPAEYGEPALPTKQ